MARIDHASLAERAKQKLGLILEDDLTDLEIRPKQVRAMVRDGVIAAHGRGVYLHRVATPGPHQRLLVATHLAGEGAVASHLTAAWLWGFDGVKPDGMELSVPATRRPRVPRARIHRSGDLLTVDTTMRGHQPITTPARTLLDIAGRLDTDQLEEALDGARRRGQIQVPFLQWRVAELRRSGRPGIAGIEALLSRERTSAKAESWLESAFLRVVRDAFLPPPRVQVVVQPRDGRRGLRVDAFYDDQDLVAEVNGHGSHATRRQLQADAERRARLLAVGLRVVDFTYDDVRHRPDHVAARLAALLGLDHGRP